MECGTNLAMAIAMPILLLGILWILEARHAKKNKGEKDG